MTPNLDHPQVVSPEEWLAARLDLLAKEKAIRSCRISLERQKLDHFILESLPLAAGTGLSRHSSAIALLCPVRDHGTGQDGQ